MTFVIYGTVMEKTMPQQDLSFEEELQLKLKHILKAIELHREVLQGILKLNQSYVTKFKQLEKELGIKFIDDDEFSK